MELLTGSNREVGLLPSEKDFVISQEPVHKKIGDLSLYSKAGLAPFASW